MNHKIEKEIKIFADSIQKGYYSETFVKHLCTVKEYNPRTDEGKEFCQIPLRINMKNNDFNGHVNNTILGKGIGRKIAFGEFNYIMEKLKNRPIDNTIKEDEPKEIIRILSDLSSSFNPKYLLVPIDSKLYHSIHELINQGIAIYDQNNIVISFRSYKITVIWSSKQRPFDYIYLLDKNAITWIYKTKKDMKPIPNIKDYNEDLNKDSSVLSLIYKEVDREKIDFIFRVVVLAEIKVGKVIAYAIKKQI